MALRMIDFKCDSCGHIFEELADATDGIAEPEECPKCGKEATMIMDISTRIHRQGNRYRDVSWIIWAIS
jgi:putative FmdB family regulatory protein